MNTIRIYINESLDVQQLETLKHLMMDISHVVDVETSNGDSHEFVVEYEDHHNMPIKIIETLRREGFHPDIISG